MKKTHPIRPTVTDILLRGLKHGDTYDGRAMSEHVHLLTTAARIEEAFAAEGIDLESVVGQIIATQQVTITNEARS